MPSITESEPQKWIVSRDRGRVYVRSFPATHKVIADVGEDTPENRARAHVLASARQLVDEVRETNRLLRRLMEFGINPASPAQTLDAIRLISQLGARITTNDLLLQQAGDVDAKRS